MIIAKPYSDEQRTILKDSKCFNFLLLNGWRGNPPKNCKSDEDVYKWRKVPYNGMGLDHREDVTPEQAYEHIDNGGLIGIAPIDYGAVVIDCDEVSVEVGREAISKTLNEPIEWLPSGQKGRGHFLYGAKKKEDIPNGAWYANGVKAGEIRGSNGYIVIWDPIKVMPALEAAYRLDDSYRVTNAQLTTLRTKPKGRGRPKGSTNKKQRHDRALKEVGAWYRRGGSQAEYQELKQSFIESVEGDPKHPEPEKEFDRMPGWWHNKIEEDKELSDVGLAKKWQAEDADNHRFVPALKIWRKYDHKTALWSNIEGKDEAVGRTLSPMLSGMAADIPDEKIAQNLESSARHNAVIALLKMFRSEVSANQYDADKSKLLMPNGKYLDLESSKISQGKKLHNFTHSLGASIDLENEPTEFIEKLNQWLENTYENPQDIIDYLQILLGAMLDRNPEALQQGLLLYGKQDSGKSTFLGTIAKVIGDYAWALQPNDILYNKGSHKHPAWKVPMQGCVFVYVPDIPKNSTLDAAEAKPLLTGDTISTRVMSGMPYNYEPTALIAISANHVIRMEPGMVSRFVTIRFNNSFKRGKGGKKDALATRLAKEEGGAILNWMLQGYKIYKSHGMPDMPPELSAEVETLQEAGKSFLQQQLEDKFTITGDMKHRIHIAEIASIVNTNNPNDKPYRNQDIAKELRITTQLREEPARISWKDPSGKIHKGRVWLGIQHKDDEDSYDFSDI